jgi:hypothetical protein
MIRPTQFTLAGKQMQDDDSDWKSNLVCTLVIEKLLEDFKWPILVGKPPKRKSRSRSSKPDGVDVAEVLWLQDLRLIDRRSSSMVTTWFWRNWGSCSWSLLFAKLLPHYHFDGKETRRRSSRIIAEDYFRELLGHRLWFDKFGASQSNPFALTFMGENSFSLYVLIFVDESNITLDWYEKASDELVLFRTRFCAPSGKQLGMTQWTNRLLCCCYDCYNTVAVEWHNCEWAPNHELEAVPSLILPTQLCNINPKTLASHQILFGEAG